jgi:hypothetical protein
MPNRRRSSGSRRKQHHTRQGKLTPAHKRHASPRQIAIISLGVAALNLSLTFFLVLLGIPPAIDALQGAHQHSVQVIIAAPPGSKIAPRPGASGRPGRAGGEAPGSQPAQTPTAQSPDTSVGGSAGPSDGATTTISPDIPKCVPPTTRPGKSKHRRHRAGSACIANPAAGPSSAATQSAETGAAAL